MIPKKHRLLVSFFLLVCFFYWMSLYLYVPTLPTYIQSKEVSLSVVGIILALYGLWQALLRIPVGLMVDITGKSKLFIIGGFLLCSTGALIMGYGDSVFLIGFGRTLTGLAAATWVPLFVEFSAIYSQDETVFASTLLNLSASLGRMVATSITGFLNNIGGYSLAFLLAAVSGIGAASTLGCIPERKRKPATTSVHSFARLIVRYDILLPTLTNTIAQYGNWVVIFGFLPILAQYLNAPDVVKGLLVSSSIVCMTAGNLLNTYLVKRIKHTTILYASFLLLSIGIFTAALAPSYPFLFFVSFCMGFSNGFISPILMGMSIQKVHPSQRTTAMGIHQSVYAIGMFAGPWLGGMLADTIGIRMMFGITAGFCLVASYTFITTLQRLMKQNI